MKLGDIARVQGGYAFKSSEFQDTGTPIIRIGNLDGDFVNIDNKICYPKEFSIKHPEFLIDKGDVLVAMSGATVGKIGVFIDDTKALLNQRVGKIIPLGGIDKRVLYYYCKSPSFMKLIQKEAFGCAQPNISSRSLEGFEINIPNIDKHNEMINVLDRVSKIIKNKKQQLNEYDQLIKSRFVEMFGDPILNQKGWNSEKLQSVCPVNKYKGEVENISGKVWLLNLDMIESNTGKIIDYVYEDENKIASSTIKFDTNCVLYSKLRPYLNKVVVPSKSGYATSEMISMKTDNINKYFLSNLLMMNSFVDFANGTSYGAKMPRASVDMIKNFDLMLPPKTLQDDFGLFVEQIDKLKFEVKKSLDETQKLFDSLMQEYFG